VYLKIPGLIIFLLFLSVMVSAQEGDVAVSAIAAPEFESPDSNFTNSGSIKISWKLPESIAAENNYTYVLQQSLSPDFDSVKIRYSGPDLATYISGLKNGTYNYRIRSVRDGKTSPWSEVIVVTVEHHSLQLAFILFGLGAIVFIATVFVVVKGVRGQSSDPLPGNFKQGG